MAALTASFSGVKLSAARRPAQRRAAARSVAVKAKYGDESTFFDLQASCLGAAAARSRWRDASRRQESGYDAEERAWLRGCRQLSGHRKPWASATRVAGPAGEARSRQPAQVAASRGGCQQSLRPRGGAARSGRDRERGARDPAGTGRWAESDRRLSPPQDLESTTGSWTVYGVDEPKRYASLQNQFFERAAQGLTRREALYSFLALAVSTPGRPEPGKVSPGGAREWGR